MSLYLLDRVEQKDTETVFMILHLFVWTCSVVLYWCFVDSTLKFDEKRANCLDFCCVIKNLHESSVIMRYDAERAGN